VKQIIYILLIFTLFSCIPDRKDDTTTLKDDNSSKNIFVKHANFVTVKPVFIKEIENWTEYRNANLFLQKYQNISPNDALNNALELQELTANLRDSIDVEILKNPSFQARVNVLHNEVLRLSDMTFISAIKAEEVNTQVEKIGTIFSSINDKINTVFTQKKFEDEIDVDDFFIGLDSTKLNIDIRKPPKKELLKIDAISN